MKTNSQPIIHDLTQTSEDDNLYKKSLPSRERAIQTDIKSMVEIGTQINCETDDFIFENYPFEKKSSTIEDPNFLSFVSQQTDMFPNGMLVCKLCGEISKSVLEQQTHMIIHYGPRALCWTCGQQLEHSCLMKKHICICSERPPIKRIKQLKCPFFNCRMSASSTRALNKHIQYHYKRKNYSCAKCRKSFSGVFIFLLHRKTKVACAKANLRIIHRVKHLSSKAIRTCSVCLKTFSNVCRCNWHQKSCLAVHYSRLAKIAEKNLNLKQ